MKVSDLSVSPIVSKNGRSQLGIDYKPSRFSVICGRGKDSYDHAGNQHFRELASMFVARYARAGSKADKSEIVSEMVGIIHQAEGIFCKFKEGVWCKVGDHYAREKAGALLREMVQIQHSSSSLVKAKQVKKAKKIKIKAKATSPKIQKQTKTQNQQYGQQLVDGTTRHSKHDSTPMTQSQYIQLLVEYDAVSHSEDSPSPTQQYGEHEQVVESGTASAGHSDDFSVSTLSYWGEDPQGLEENWMEDEDDFFEVFGAECCILII